MYSAFACQEVRACALKHVRGDLLSPIMLERVSSREHARSACQVASSLQQSSMINTTNVMAAAAAASSPVSATASSWAIAVAPFSNVVLRGIVAHVCAACPLTSAVAAVACTRNGRWRQFSTASITRPREMGSGRPSTSCTIASGSKPRQWKTVAR